MLRLSKKDLAARAKKMKVVAQASPLKDLKLKVVAEVGPSDDEETYSGPVFKRRRKVVPESAEHSASNGRATSPRTQVPPTSPPPS